MILLYFLCIGLSVLSLSESKSGLRCGKDPNERKKAIYLITLYNDMPQRCELPSIDSPTKSDLMNAMNCDFLKKCSDVYDIIYYQVDDVKTGFEETLNIAKEGLNVINLFAYDYYSTTHKKYDGFKKLIFAGDVYDALHINENIKISGNWRNVTYLPNFFNDTVLHKKVQIDIPGAKIMNKKLSKLNSGDLFEFVSSMHFSGKNVKSRESCSGVVNTSSDLTTVLICMDSIHCFDDDKKPYYNGLKFKFVSTHECHQKIQYLTNNLLAVLAPEPFKMDTEFIIPTIFYRTQYLSPEYAPQFPNSMNLVSGELLTHGFLKFINRAGWRRIAIISDYSTFSILFENDLVQRFSQEGKIYNIHRCEEEDCFIQALTELINMDARIVIANVNEHNARKLYQAFKIRRNDKLWLIFRVWPVWSEYTQAVSITIGPKLLEEDNCYSNLGTPHRYEAQKPSCAGILHGLRIVTQAHYLTTLVKTASSRKEYYKKFYTHTKDLGHIPSLYATAYITRLDSEKYPLSTMTISSSGDVELNSNYEDPFNPIPLDEKRCIIKTSKFANPCDLNVVLLFMFVVILFSITVLSITCYFHSTSPIHATRYQQF